MATMSIATLDLGNAGVKRTLNTMKILDHAGPVRKTEWLVPNAAVAKATSVSLVYVKIATQKIASELQIKGQQKFILIA